jgi:hypothetical protein
MMTDIGTKEHYQALDILARTGAFSFFKAWIEKSIAEIRRVTRFSVDEETQRLIGEAAVLQDLLDHIGDAPKRLEGIASAAPKQGIRTGEVIT